MDKEIVVIVASAAVLLSAIFVSASIYENKKLEVAASMVEQGADPLAVRCMLK